MQLMKEGAKWELYIPSELGYGDRGAGADIPGGAVLVFTLELLKVRENVPHSCYLLISVYDLRRRKGVFVFSNSARSRFRFSFFAALSLHLLSSCR